MGLIEVVVAMALLAFILIAMTAAMASALRQTRTNRERVVAANLATEEMELLRLTPFASLPLGLTTVAKSVGASNFTVTREIQYVSLGSTSGPCDGPGSSSDLARVDISVAWPNMGVIQPVRSTTTITAGRETYDPDKGNLGVKVIDAAAQPRSPIQVLVTGPTAQPAQSTPATGCAFFALLLPGTYTASLNAPGYVDGQGDPTPSQTQGVSAGNTTQVLFQFDQAATLVVDVQGQSPSSVLPLGLPVNVANTGLTTPGTKVTTGATYPRTIPSLFPYSSGYQIWAGDCPAADPEGLKADGSRYWPSASRNTPAVTNPNSTTNAVTMMAPLVVTVVDEFTGTPVTGVAVNAVQNDADCPAATSYLIGVTDSAGQIEVALPYGSWQINVPSLTPGTSWPVVIMDPALSGISVQVETQ